VGGSGVTCWRFLPEIDLSDNAAGVRGIHAQSKLRRYFRLGPCPCAAAFAYPDGIRGMLEEVEYRGFVKGLICYLRQFYMYNNVSVSEAVGVVVVLVAGVSCMRLAQVMNSICPMYSVICCESHVMQEVLPDGPSNTVSAMYE
jgi:hypothetical protein